MKKLFLFLAVSGLALSSCSDDDNGSSVASSNVNLTVDGVAKTSTAVDVNQEEFPAEGSYPAYTELTVAASGSNGTELVNFYLDEGDTGADVIFNFSYTINGVTYYNYSEGFNIIVTENSGNHIKGSFNGNLVSTNFENEITVTNGTFDISY